MEALSSARPPGRPLSTRLALVAAMYLFIAASTGALTALGFVASLFDDYGYGAREVIGGLASAMISIVAGLTAVGLLRRRTGARAVALVLSVALFTAAVWLILGATVLTPGGHGSAYVFMGGVQLMAGGVAATVALVLPTTKTCFEPAPGGWYPDPMGQGRWRVWDGHHWTEHIA